MNVCMHRHTPFIQHTLKHKYMDNQSKAYKSFELNLVVFGTYSKASDQIVIK